MSVGDKPAILRVISLASILSAVLAAALTPFTNNVASRPRGIVVWSGVPLAVVIAGSLAWSSGRFLTVTALLAVGLASTGAVLATQVVIDACVRRLPRQLSYAGLVVLIGSMTFVEPAEAAGIGGMVLGAVVMTAVAILLVLISRGALGIGDVHLSPLLGALVGWFAPGAVLLAWMIIAISGALFTSVGLATRKLARGSMIPYGPFMVFGSIVSILMIAIRS